MTAQELRQVALLLANISFNRIAKIYGYDPIDPISKSGTAYLEGKLTQAIDNPVYWLCNLDYGNLQNLCAVAKEIN